MRALRPPGQDPFLDSLRAERGLDLASITGCYVTLRERDLDSYNAERKTTLAEIQKRFAMRLESPSDAKFVRFKLEERS